MRRWAPTPKRTSSEPVNAELLEAGFAEPAADVDRAIGRAAVARPDDGRAGRAEHRQRSRTVLWMSSSVMLPKMPHTSTRSRRNRTRVRARSSTRRRRRPRRRAARARPRSPRARGRARRGVRSRRRRAGWSASTPSRSRPSPAHALIARIGPGGSRSSASRMRPCTTTRRCASRELGVVVLAVPFAPVPLHGRESSHDLPSDPVGDRSRRPGGDPRRARASRARARRYVGAQRRRRSAATSARSAASIRSASPPSARSTRSARSTPTPSCTRRCSRARATSIQLLESGKNVVTPVGWIYPDHNASGVAGARSRVPEGRRHAARHRHQSRVGSPSGSRSRCRRCAATSATSAPRSSPTSATTRPRWSCARSCCSARTRRRRRRARCSRCSGTGSCSRST